MSKTPISLNTICLIKKKFVLYTHNSKYNNQEDCYFLIIIIGIKTLFWFNFGYLKNFGMSNKLIT